MKKRIKVGKNNITVELIKERHFWYVYVDKILWYESANELFAVQRFNEI